jgi:hypothetical protein
MGILIHVFAGLKRILSTTPSYTIVFLLFVYLLLKRVHRPPPPPDIEPIRYLFVDKALVRRLDTACLKIPRLRASPSARADIESYGFALRSG